MRLSRAVRSTAGTALLAASLLCAGVQTAGAAPGPVVDGDFTIQAGDADGAVGGYYWKTNPVYKFVGSGQRVYGQSGGTITITKGTTKTISGSITGTTSGEANIIFAKATVSVGVTIGGSYAVTVTNAYSWQVPANQANGWVEMGSAGYRIDWQKGIYQAPCTFVTKGSGVITGVTKSPAFAHS
jgi:hypothetical protein